MATGTCESTQTDTQPQDSQHPLVSRYGLAGVGLGLGLLLISGVGVSQTVPPQSVAQPATMVRLVVGTILGHQSKRATRGGGHPCSG